ncbi:MAG TPA: hypothetical protein VHN18_06615, partial [Micromonosporaceae bacterium]|nr:hypothetical protein [Micromonosporaceae bacterium]
ALFAVFGNATGLAMTQVALWAPVWNNALWLLGLAALVRQFTTDRRHVWLSIWIFASVNWIDQDYFSPQAFAFLLYLVILALMLRLLRRNSPMTVPRRLRAVWEGMMRWLGFPTGPGPGSPDWARPTGDRARGLLLVTVLSAAMIASHQLTPFALLVAVAALVLVGASTPRLPVILLLILTAWLVLPASTYLGGHPVLNGHNLSSTVGDNLTDRIIGSPERLFVLRLRMILTAAVWALAAVGLVRRWRAGHRDVACVALAAAPFVLLPAQSYGGEMLLRVTLYSLPFAGFFAAAALLPRSGGRTAGLASRILRAALIAVLGSVLGAASVAARYGNARFDVFTPGDVAGVHALYAYARPGDVLFAGGHATPWRYRDYDAYRYLSIQDLCKAPDLTAEGCFDRIRDEVRLSPSDRGLILMNRANRQAIRMQNLLPAGMLAGVEERLGTVPGGRLVLATPEARLYELRIDWSSS